MLEDRPTILMRRSASCSLYPWLTAVMLFLLHISSSSTNATRYQRSRRNLDDIRNIQYEYYDNGTFIVVEVPIYEPAAATEDPTLTQQYCHNPKFMEDNEVAREQISTGQIKKHSIRFLLHDSSTLPINVVSFCQHHKVPWNTCRFLHRNIADLHHYLLNTLKYSSEDQLHSDKNKVSVDKIPNPHLTRLSTAIDSELENLRSDINHHRIDNMIKRERLMEEWLKKWVDRNVAIPQSSSSNSDANRIDKETKPKQITFKQSGNIISLMNVNQSSSNISHSEISTNQSHQQSTISVSRQSSLTRRNIRHFTSSPTSRIVIIHSCLIPTLLTNQQQYAAGDMESQIANVTNNFVSFASVDYLSIEHRERKQTDSIKRKTRVLRFLLDEVHEYLLINKTKVTTTKLNATTTTSANHLVQDTSVFVFHFGDPLPLSVVKAYPFVQFFHISNDISFFEIPTMRIIQSLSKYVVNSYKTTGLEDYLLQRRYPGLPFQHSLTNRPNVFPQLLYLHTKGVSYATVYAQIEEWKHYMLYFLLEKQSVARGILASGKYDIYGTNYETNSRVISGNFWWASTSYLASSQLQQLDYWKSEKYSAEKWLFVSWRARPYIPFESGMNHPYTRFPRYCYAPIEEYYQKNRQRFQRDDMFYVLHETNTGKEVINGYDSEGNQITDNQGTIDQELCHTKVIPNHYCISINPFSFVYEADIVPNFTIWKINCGSSLTHYRKIHNIAPLITREEIATKLMDDITGCKGFEIANRKKFVVV